MNDVTLHHYLKHCAQHMHTVGSGTVKKVVEINKYLLGTVAGGAGEDFCDL